MDSNPATKSGLKWRLLMAQVTIGIKNGAGSVSIETDDLPAQVYEAALIEGLKVLCHKGMSKLTKANLPDDEARKAEIARVAQANAAELVKKDADGNYVGSVKLDSRRASGPKVSGEVKTEAMRLARNLAKDEIKKAGIKVSHVAASEITAAAKMYLEAYPHLLETAKKNIEERKAATTAEGEKKVDIKSIIKIDPKLVAKANEKNAKAKASKAKGEAEPISAAQAGQVQKRSKPTATARPN